MVCYKSAHQRKSPRRVYPSYLTGDNVDYYRLNEANVFFAETGKRVTDLVGGVDPECGEEFRGIDGTFNEYIGPALDVIEKTMNRQASSKTPGQDRITNRTLQLDKVSFIPVLQHFGQRISATGMYPMKFKQAVVVLGPRPFFHHFGGSSRR